MALIKCKECGREISKTASSCPQCGAKIKRTGLLTKILAGFFVLILVSVIVKTVEDAEKAKRGTSEPVPVAALTPEQNAGDKKSAPAQQLPSSKVGSAITLSQMRLKQDKMEGLTFYHDKSSPSHPGFGGFFLYFATDKTEVLPLHLLVSFRSDHWLFVRRYWVRADGIMFEPVTSRWERDNDTSIWEWSDSIVGAEDLTMLRAIAVSKDATIRFEGQQYHNDVKLTAQQKRAITHVLDAYAALGGKL